MRKLAAKRDAGRFQHAHFFQQRRQIDHHAVADHSLTPGRRMPLGNQLQNELLLADEDRVPGVVAALIARHNIEALGKQIDDFAFALVAPLRAQNDYVAHAMAIVATRYYGSVRSVDKGEVKVISESTSR